MFFRPSLLGGGSSQQQPQPSATGGTWWTTPVPSIHTLLSANTNNPQPWSFLQQQQPPTTSLSTRLLLLSHHNNNSNNNLLLFGQQQQQLQLSFLMSQQPSSTQQSSVGQQSSGASTQPNSSTGSSGSTATLTSGTTTTASAGSTTPSTASLLANLHTSQQWSDMLTRLFNDLRTVPATLNPLHEATRDARVRNIVALVIQCSRDAPLDIFSKFVNSLNDNLFDLIAGSGTTPADKLGAIAAIQALAAVEYEENVVSKLAHFCQLLRHVLSASIVFDSPSSATSTTTTTTTLTLTNSGSGNTSGANTTSSASATTTTTTTKDGSSPSITTTTSTGGANTTASTSGITEGALMEQAVMVAAAASRALGYLARYGGTQTADSVETDVKRALDWLTSAPEKRLVACLILKELAINAPVVFYISAPIFFQNIWQALRDRSSPAVRIEAHEALCACLALCEQRDSISKHDWYKRLYSEADRELALSTTTTATATTANSTMTEAGVHGALLVLDAMLRYAKEFVRPHSVDMARYTVAHRDTKDRATRRTVIILLPLLARFDPREFVYHHLNTCMTYLLALIKSAGPDRALSFLAAGDVAVAVGGEIAPYLELLVAAIKTNLTVKNKGGICMDAVTCTAQLTAALGNSHSSMMANHVQSLLPLMFATGLSQHLVVALKDMCRAMPQVIPPLTQPRLFELISSVLTQSSTPYGVGPSSSSSSSSSSSITPSRGASSIIRSISNTTSLLSNLTGGSNSSSATTTTTTNTTTSDRKPSDGGSSTASNTTTSGGGQNTTTSGGGGGGGTTASSTTPGNAIDHHQDPQLVLLALHTLCTFDFYLLDLLGFVRDTLLHYLEDDNPEIRREAALTCATLVVKPGEAIPTRGHSAALIGDIVQKLIILGITDRDSLIRKSIFFVLDCRFDTFLAQPEILRSLFAALNDENIEIRELAITVLGRLATRNPAYVMPALRKTLIQLLNEIEYGNNRNKEESALLLGHLIRSSERLVRPYVEPILRTLLPKLKSSGSGRVASCVLSALGDLAVVGTEDLRCHINELLPTIIETLHDQSATAKRAAKREVALRTLGQLVRSTGHIVSPLEVHPQLLELIMSELQTERLKSVRAELLKVLGILGAVDPYRHRQAKERYAKFIRQQQQLIQQLQQQSTQQPKQIENTKQTSTTATAANATAVTTTTTAAPTVAASLSPSGVSVSNNTTTTTGGAPTTTQQTTGQQQSQQQQQQQGTTTGGGGGGGGAASAFIELPQVASSSEEYNPTVVITALLRILRDTNLSAHHRVAVKDLVQSLRSLGMKCVPFLPYIMPALFYVMRHCEPPFREFLFQQLGALVSVIKQHVRDYMHEIFDLMREFWGETHTNSLVHILTLAEEISLAINDEFKLYLPTLIPLMLRELTNDRSPRRHFTQKVIRTLEVFGTNLDDYLHLVVPAIVMFVEQQQDEAPVSVTAGAVRALQRLCRKLNFSDLASRIVHPFARVLEKTAMNVNKAELRESIMSLLCTMVKHLGADYAIFIPMVNKVITRQRIQHQEYESLINHLLKNQTSFLISSEEIYHQQANDATSDSSSQQQQQQTQQQILLNTEENNAIMQQQQQTTAAPPGKLELNLANLKMAWETSIQRVTKEDWMEWMRQFSGAFLRESPSPALRSCQSLAQDYPPLVRELFNAAFLSCWNELSESAQEQLVRALNMALASPSIPPEILQMLLNLAEYMEHEEKPLPIDNLGNHAQRCHAYAKALHYKEQEFQINNSNVRVIEDLISINNQLQLPEAAVGVLLFAQQRHPVELQEGRWYEKLGRWEDALKAYEDKQKEDPTNKELLMGRMRCLNALSEWDSLSHLISDTWNRTATTEETRREMAPLAAASSWHLGQWSNLDEYTRSLTCSTDNPQQPSSSSGGAASSSPSPSSSAAAAVVVGVTSGSTSSYLAGGFYRAMVALNRGDFMEASGQIEAERSLLDAEMAALAAESYDRAYTVVVRLQQLAELEEVMEFKQAVASAIQSAASGLSTTASQERQRMIREIWRARLLSCKGDIDTWQNILRVHSLVLSPMEDLKMWLKFAGLCRKNGRHKLASRTIQSLIGHGVDQVLSPYVAVSSLAIKAPRIALAFIKNMWHSSTDIPGMTEALHTLQQFRNVICSDQQQQLLIQQQQQAGEQLQPQQQQMIDIVTNQLKAKTHLKLGEWQLALTQQQDSFNDTAIPQILASFRTATDFEPEWYKAWHAWALINFEVVSYYERHGVSSDCIVPYLTTSIHGFFKSIALGPDQPIQDTLRLLTLLFKHGQQKEVENALMEGFGTVKIDTWLQVIPQIIARISSHVPAIRRLTHELLGNIGRNHPHALVYSLTVASKSHSTTRLTAARLVMDKMRRIYPTLIDQALLVSKELIRVAILWHELWYEGLEEASRLYYNEHDIPGMLNTLAPLHQLLEQGPETARETSFQQSYGRELQEALEWCKKYQRTNTPADIQQAWEIYCNVFRRIYKLPQLTTLELSLVSPKLQEQNMMDLAVPGTYQSGQPLIKIKRFYPFLTVIPSKQRPRKLTIIGSNDVEYKFLLKGHEDLRQDERVMQLFGLVNNLLEGNRDTSSCLLGINTYAVIPLSPNSGLIGWVPHSDTLHQLIREYRESRQILLNIEHRIMLQMGPYDQLTLPQKVEVFQYALDTTDGQDLERVLWLKSSSSEVWLERRTAYTRSVAVMSMVGYILGLGDRHPSNLMLDRYSGQVVHIDFGDCFEVAMHRDKYPEKIPFRLTRMLVNAMEVSGIEGNYRFTCEKVMRVLRQNKDSLMAVLEAFVYDPLINWRLFQTSPDLTAPPPPPHAAAIAAEQQQQQQQQLQTTNQPSSPPLPPPPPVVVVAPIPIATPSSVTMDIADKTTTTATTTTTTTTVVTQTEALNEKALVVIKRVSKKLTGRDFGNQLLDVPAQVDRLIKQATSHENLCQCYIGWCPFW